MGVAPFLVSCVDYGPYQVHLDHAGCWLDLEGADESGKIDSAELVARE